MNYVIKLSHLLLNKTLICEKYSNIPSSQNVMSKRKLLKRSDINCCYSYVMFT